MTGFGFDPGSSWGEDPGTGNESEPSSDPGGESSYGDIDLGGGIKLRIPPEFFRIIMHSPQITAAVAQRCEEIASTANSMAVLPEAEYEVYVSNNPENIRARGRVKTANYKARVDNSLNSTLLKALASVGSDPYPSWRFEAGYDPASEREVPEAVPPGPEPDAQGNDIINLDEP